MHAPEHADRFRRRERAYESLVRASRTAAGFLGTGAEATRHSADAVNRLAGVSAESPIPVSSFRDLNMLFRQVDNALCAALEQGFGARIYLVRRTLPRIDSAEGRLTHQCREIFDPLARDSRTPLIALARRHLHTDPARMAAPGSTTITRDDFRAEMSRRRKRGSALSL